MTDEEQTFGVSPASGGTVSPQTEQVSPPVVPNAEEVSPASGDVVSPQTEEVSPLDVPNGDNKKRVDVKLPSSVRPALDALRMGEETDAAVLKRLLETVPTLIGQVNDLTSELENAQSVNVGIREDLDKELQRHQETFDDHVTEIGGLRAQVTTLTSRIEKGLVPVDEQSKLEVFGSTGMKDIADEISEGCQGDDVCIGTVVKLQQTRIDAMSKCMDRDHDGEQKQLARDHDATQRQVELDAKREAQEKDRALKAELAEKEHANKLELVLAKKGGFKQELLDEVVFISGGTSKHPRKDLADAERRAHHAATNEDNEDWMAQDPEGEEELTMHPEFEEDEI